MGAADKLQLWEVVGGADTGGILVREGKDLTSAKCSDRLATGALVVERDIAGDRLCYRKLRGRGPDVGWVSRRLKGRDLLTSYPPAPGPFDGRWDDSEGVVVIVRGNAVLWPDHVVMDLEISSANPHQCSMMLPDFSYAQGCLMPDGVSLSWADGDVWKRLPEPKPQASSSTTLRTLQDDKAFDERRRHAEASGCRIMALVPSEESAPLDWHQVLGLEERASVDEVKRAYKELALLHHPDKGLSDAAWGDEVFRRVQLAYEHGLVAAAATALEVAEPVPDSADGALVVKPVKPTSGKAEIRAAVEIWEEAWDQGHAPTYYDDIQVATVEQMVAWTLGEGCTTVDIRDANEKIGSKTKDPIPGAIIMEYVALLKTPERYAAILNVLRGTPGPIILYSSKGGVSGNCGAAAGLLVDVFCIDVDNIYRLEDGYLCWVQWSRQPQNAALLDQITAWGRGRGARS
eukprot:gnl/TRDRNA2_/TRDRNA2_155990_c0_seq1.p1 gnl/TRDRNA2_/TRDRNA2_155990_c0~~gnl/TRDRNA2_/TRDRNA2_155990_c0_seq1.p1  ORF type:complete len:460 (+),score=82.65 gnl/TRDRNA2_/TRDRNA2_155990_c0_seq1:120-1499(+)